MTPQYSTLTMLKRLFREHMRGYMPKFFLALFFMILEAAGTASLAKLMEPVLDEIFVSKNETMLYVIAAAVMGIFIVKAAATYGQSAMMNAIGFRIVADLQKRLFARLMQADIAYYHEQRTGNLISRLVNDARMLQNTVSAAVTGFGKDFFTLLFLIIVMFMQDWRLAMWSFFAFPTAIYPIFRLGNRMRKVTGLTQEQFGAFNGLLSQIFLNIRQVKAYCRESFEQHRVGGAIDTMLRSILKANKIRSAAPPMMEILGGAAIVTAIVYGGHQVIAGTKTPGNFFSFITALLMAYEPIKKLSRTHTAVQEGMAAAQRIFEVIDYEPAIKDPPNAKPLALQHGMIEFSHVRFRYGNETVLHDLSFTIPAGKTVALVGTSGAGKSTIINLLPRFYDIESGEISIDGQNIATVTTESLRQHMALVSQEIALFDDTVYNNITYGALDANPEQVYEAARQAAAEDFILQLPHGYDTVIGEQGVSLSGGQRQRLAIARAMLKNAPILLLDEATSSLDTVSEQLIQQTLKVLMQGRSTLVIAHRLSTIIDADIIHVLEAGQIIESGTHQTLLASNGSYARLWAMQFREQAAYCLGRVIS